MASTAFAAIQTRLNSVTLDRLSDCEVTLADGSVVGGIFDAPYALGDVGPIGMASSAPQLRLATEALDANVVGQTLAVGSTTYTVLEHDPDGTGLSRLLLERVT